MVTTVTEPRLMGAQEIAERLQVSRQRVQQLTERADWPAPYATLSLGRVWRANDIERWIAEHRPAPDGE
jgi:prophage regulatory protein